MTTTTDAQEPRESRRRSRSRRRRSGSTNEVIAELLAALRSRVAGRVIAVVMLILAIGYVFGLYRTFSLEHGVYGGVAIGGNYETTLYSVGRPAQVKVDPAAPWTPYAGPGRDRIWHYRLVGEGQMNVQFDDGIVTSVTCTNVDAVLGSCPIVHGIGVGQTEEMLFTHLGFPRGQSLSAQRKTVFYPELGLEIGLETYTIMQIRQVQPSGGTAFLRFLRTIVP